MNLQCLTQSLICNNNNYTNNDDSCCCNCNKPQTAINNKAAVVPLLHCRGRCIPLWAVFPSLQVVLSFACSVASLSRSPGHQLPGCHSLHCGILADYLLGWGRPSTCSTGHAEFQSTSSPSPHRATGDWVLPATSMQIVAVRQVWATCQMCKWPPKGLSTHCVVL